MKTFAIPSVWTNILGNILLASDDDREAERKEVEEKQKDQREELADEQKAEVEEEGKEEKSKIDEDLKK